MALILANLLCFLHFCTRGGGGGWGRNFDDNFDNHLSLVCCYLLMHIFMFDSFQLFFDLFIFWILRMVITGSAKLVVTLKTTAFSVHSCLTQNVISLLRGIPFKWSLEHNFCLTSLTSSPSGIISGFGSACVFNLTSFSWNATLVLCHISKATCHQTSLNFFSLHAQLYCSQLSLWLNRL